MIKVVIELSKIVSPLRYPGGKSALCYYIEKFIDEQNISGCHIIEPYAGSSIISLDMLQKGKAAKATLVEKDPLIYSFWQSVFTQTEKLIELIESLPITIETWHNFQHYRAETNLENCTVLEMGLAGLFFNRTNFSGILKANPIGGLGQNSEHTIDCRFNKERIIKSILSISKFHTKVALIHGDALHILENNKNLRKGNVFFYIDPPYYLKGKSLYRHWHDTQQHQHLSTILKKIRTKPWLLSYDDNPEIRKLYQTQTTENIYLDYHVSSYRKNHPEILLSNREIPPWEIKQFKKELA